MAECLSENLYEPLFFGISKKGRWQLLEGPHGQEVVPDSGGPPLSAEVLEAIERCDLLFPVLHGPYGEDGTIQGFFEMLGKPYAGCGHRTSALSMDKVLTKALAEREGLPVKPFLAVREEEWRRCREALFQKIVKKLRFPVFVKPSHYGSAIGVARVEGEEALEEAFRKAFCYDDSVIIEEGVLSPREMEFALFGNDRIRLFPPGEVLTGGAVYDYEAKYGEGGFGASPVAELPEEKVREGMGLARSAFEAVGGRGFARVDFFLDGEGKFWFNEINPIPGFTEISLFPKICEAHGVPGKKLIDWLIILGLHKERKARR